MDASDTEVERPKNPEVQFSLNPELDIWKINDFFPRVSPPSGHNFQQIITREHPDLKGLEILSDDDRLKRIKEYVSGYYQEHQEQLSIIIDQVNGDWQEYAPTFFAVTSKLFKGLTWPPGEYRGFLSISSPYPRFLDNKTFQFPIGDQNWRLSVIAHEMLHFMFYEYIRKRYTPQLQNTDQQEMERLLEGKFIIPLWELSEVFNTALLTPDRFGKGGRTPRPFPALKDHLKTFSKIWQESDSDIDLLFSKLENGVY